MRKTRNIAIVGAGTIGCGWIACFLAKGQTVSVFDTNQNTMELIAKRLEDIWPILTTTDPSIPDGIPDFQLATSIEDAVGSAGFVQESGPENEELKIELLAQISAAAPAEAIIASSSSSLLVSRLQSKCSRPERCLVGHPFNPPYLVPLVEIVASDINTASVVKQTEDFYLEMGKQPLVLSKEISGYIANRLQNAVFKESMHLVSEGVATVAEIDAAMKYGPGLRWAIMGPFLTFALGGGMGGMRRYFDIFEEEIATSWQELGNPQLTPDLVETVIRQADEFFQRRSIGDSIRWRDESLAQVCKLAKLIQCNLEQET